MAHRQRVRSREVTPDQGHSMSKAQSHKGNFFFFKDIASSWRLEGMQKVRRAVGWGQGQLMQVLKGSGRPN